MNFAQRLHLSYQVQARSDLLTRFPILRKLFERDGGDPDDIPGLAKARLDGEIAAEFLKTYEALDAKDHATLYTMVMLAAYSEDYVDGIGKRLDTLVRTKPDHFSELDKGMRYKTLYRGVTLRPKEYEAFEKTRKLSSHKSFDSWSTSIEFAKSWLEEADESKEKGCVFAREVPESLRLACLPCDGLGRTEESEILCRSFTLDWDDVVFWTNLKNFNPNY